MTGAGTATVAGTVEPSFLEDPTDPTYRQYLRNVSVDDLSLENELQRIRDPDDPEPIKSVAQNFEGALNLTGTITGDDWHELVFNNDTNTGFVSGRPQFSRWWIGIDYLDGTAERVPKGAIVTQAQIQDQQGGETQLSLNMIFADEELNTTITPSNIQKGSEVAMWHDVSLDVDSVANVECNKRQSISLQIDTGARFHRGGDRIPCDAVVGAVETSLTTDYIFTEASTDRLGLAYGGVDQTSPQNSIDAVDATLSVLGTDYNLTGIKPGTTSWDDVVDPDSDTRDNTEYDVSGVGVAA
jgi:hypothetical protein